MKKTLSITILLAMLCALLSGCGAQSEPEGEGISVVATVFAPYDFARQLVGERGEVTLLLPPGSEAHSYEPSPKDIIEIQNCDLFIYVGGVSDAWVSDVLESVGGEVRTVTLMDCVELLEEEHVEGMEVDEDEHEGEIEYDEHVWTSPRNAELICEKIAAALCEVDPEGAEEYGTALESYCAQLDELDAAFTEVVENGVRDTVVFWGPLSAFVLCQGLRAQLLRGLAGMRGRGRAFRGHGHLPYRQGEGGGDTRGFPHRALKRGHGGHHLQRNGREENALFRLPQCDAGAV